MYKCIYIYICIQRSINTYMHTLLSIHRFIYMCVCVCVYVFYFYFYTYSIIMTVLKKCRRYNLLMKKIFHKLISRKKNSIKKRKV